jgi:hypothetical protein
MAIDLSDYRITILCEDIAQYDFILAYIKLLGATNKRKITKLDAFNNASVLRHYPSAVKSYRKRCQENVALIVMIDADEKTINERLREFDREIDSEKHDLNKSTRFDNEKILIFAPIRNIESWFHYIKTYNINVETLKDEYGKIISYKNLYPYPSKYTDINEFVDKLKNEICINGLPENAPSSLHDACNEINRLKN